MPAGGRSPWGADLALVGVTAIWGTTFVVNRLVLEDSPPLLFLVLRFGLAALVLAVLTRGRPTTPGLLRHGALLGVLLAVSIGCQITGQLFTTASKAAFITGLSVPLTPVVSFLVARKVPTRENLAGILLATVGFAVLAWPRDASGVSPGDLLVLVTASIYAWLIFFLGETSPLHDARRYAFVQIAFAALGVLAARLLLTPFLGGGGAFLAAEARPLPRTGGFLLAVLWMALMATVVTFVVQTWAQARMSATHAAIVFALEPVFTALFAAAVLGERMGRRDFAGASLILSGILVSDWPRRKG